MSAEFDRQSDPLAATKFRIKLLGRILGQTIAEAEGERIFETVENVRRQAKAARREGDQGLEDLFERLQSLDDTQLLPVVRSFSHFLNLVNIVEQQEGNRALFSRFEEGLPRLDASIERVMSADLSREVVTAALSALDLELVLTAHPTEITRRTLIDKHAQIDASLGELDIAPGEPPSTVATRLHRHIAGMWHTDEIRTEKPSPVDEASWGLAVVENSLWHAVPRFLRRLDHVSRSRFGVSLPVDARPVRFASWMGGDRDGNPFVTADLTRHVLLLSRRQAIKLYLKDVDGLISELSMHRCNAKLRARVQDDAEPYRGVLSQLRSGLVEALDVVQSEIAGNDHEGGAFTLVPEQVWEPLFACYQSLHECGMGIIADGNLLDTLRRVRCFGLQLTRLDIRQESGRHTQVLSEITRALGAGDYADWPESQRLEFLTTELEGERALLPRSWQPSADVAEALATFEVIAAQPPGHISAYVISMSAAPSDVLAVALLLTESGCRELPPIVPLFETLDDLESAARVVEKLLQIPGYRRMIGNEQMVMIGYSDSAKDAGVMAASWAQYRAQEALLQVCAKQSVKLRLFHGRGGSIGRGGVPTFTALFSQPPGSLMHGLRVTEQGEMIRFKLGHPDTAVGSMETYAAAILEANLTPPRLPAAEWRGVMDALSEHSCAVYRDLVRSNPNFVEYFRSATPEVELGMLPLGSRPTRRRQDAGIASLRAIPWIFAWSQNRMMLPAWLGAGEALDKVKERGQLDLLQKMYREWPFFAARLSMLEMVYAKADAELARYYDQHLVPPELRPLGEALRSRLVADIQTVLEVSNDDSLMADVPATRESVRLRNTYTDPLNLLQVELLRRYRSDRSKLNAQALMVSIAGISAGLRNTG